MEMRYTNEEFILEIGRIRREMSELTHISNKNARLTLTQLLTHIGQLLAELE